jgi:fructose-1,6-bisphosphatase/inositol monophosphatase family enzyme
LKNNGLYFVIDPLDGTKSFVMGKDYFSINVAVVNAFDGECVFGCTFFPALDKMYFTSGVGSFGADFETNLENDRSINIVTNKRSLKTKSFERIVLLLGKKFEIKSIKTIGGAYKICSLFEGGGSNVCISAEPVMEWDIASAFGFFYGREVACYNFEFNNIKFLQKCLQNILVDKLIDNQTATQSVSENCANTGGLNAALQKETLKSPILHNSTLQSFGLQNDLRSNLVEEDFLVENYIVSNTEVFNYLKSC